MEQTGCSETSEYKIQKPENYPEESTKYSEQGESLKSRKNGTVLKLTCSSYYINLVFHFNFIVPQKKRLPRMYCKHLRDVKVRR
jgi:hypothetical protein